MCLQYNRTFSFLISLLAFIRYGQLTYIIQLINYPPPPPPPPPPSTMFSNLMYDLQILSCSYSLDRSKCGRGMAADHD